MKGESIFSFSIKLDEAEWRKMMEFFEILNSIERKELSRWESEGGALGNVEVTS